METDRLLLRKLSHKDVNEVFQLRSDPDSMKYIPRPLVKNSEDAHAHIATINQAIHKNEGINWAVTIKGEDKLIGIVGFYRTSFEDFRSEIGYMILPDYYGQGIVTEVVAELVRFGFEKLGFHSIEAVIDPENIASERVLQKNGFTKEAHFRENLLHEGKYLDSVHYGILKREFVALR
ncbi:GNAT family N-acetyltransferase [Flavobacterium sp.]|uniref:GNAT family N-acetyltransferase n=1 Tax=Flavobacterium sp. TaxID=239 RepID=UPI0034587149